MTEVEVAAVLAGLIAAALVVEVVETKALLVVADNVAEVAELFAKIDVVLEVVTEVLTLVDVEDEGEPVELLVDIDNVTEDVVEAAVDAEVKGNDAPEFDVLLVNVDEVIELVDV